MRQWVEGEKGRSKGGALGHFAHIEEEGKELAIKTEINWKSQRMSLEATKRKAFVWEHYLG